MKKFLMAPPESNADDFDAAWQWTHLRMRLICAGARVENVYDHPKSNPFISNAGLIHDGRFIAASLPDMGRPEEQFYESYFGSQNMELLDVNPLGNNPTYFGGAADAIFSHDRKHLWLGINANTTFTTKARLDYLFDNYEDIVVRPLLIKNKKFAHLDECFLPLETGELIYFPEAFDSHSNMIIESWYRDKIITLSSDETHICNSISVGNSIVTSTISRETKDVLSERGYNVVEVDVSQLQQKGRSCKSLVLEVIG